MLVAELKKQKKLRELRGQEAVGPCRVPTRCVSEPDPAVCTLHPRGQAAISASSRKGRHRALVATADLKLAPPRQRVNEEQRNRHGTMSHRERPTSDPGEATMPSQRPAVSENTLDLSRLPPHLCCVTVPSTQRVRVWEVMPDDSPKALQPSRTTMKPRTQ